MSLDRAADYALGESDSGSGVEADPLSRREREVARLVAAGMTNRQIGERLFISWRTVEGHLERIRNKLGVRSRTEVATWAVDRGLMTNRVAAEPGHSKK
jgi:DNA-binding NarL/FixJ family response regulator